MKKIKKILNNFSKWLYRKTTEIEEPKTLFGGMKVYESKFIPEDTIFIVTMGKEQLSYFQMVKNSKI